MSVQFASVRGATVLMVASLTLLSQPSRGSWVVNVSAPVNGCDDCDAFPVINTTGMGSDDGGLAAPFCSQCVPNAQCGNVAKPSTVLEDCADSIEPAPCLPSQAATLPDGSPLGANEFFGMSAAAYFFSGAYTHSTATGNALAQGNFGAAGGNPFASALPPSLGTLGAASALLIGESQTGSSGSSELVTLQPIGGGNPSFPFPGPTPPNPNEPSPPGVSEVPEPSTLALLVIGVGSVRWLRRYRSIVFRG